MKWVGLPIRAAIAIFAGAVLLAIVIAATVIVTVVAPRSWSDPAAVFADAVDDLAYWTYHGEKRR